MVGPRSFNGNGHMLGKNGEPGECGRPFKFHGVTQEPINTVGHQPQGFIARNLLAVIRVDRSFGNVGAVDVKPSIRINPAGASVKG